MKKIYYENIKSIFVVIITLTMIILNSLNIYVLAENNNTLDIKAQYAIVMDMDTKKILYSKNSTDKLYPASTTKAWTAYLIIKNIDDLQQKITVEKDYSYIEPTSMYLKVGETFTVEQLLQSLMLNSSNDVAVLLAEYVAGSVEKFVDMMNEEAKKIGCENTNFINPNGLPDENHYSTAYDMALMSIEAMKNENLKQIVKMKSVVIPSTPQYEYDRIYKNSNRFISGKGQIDVDGNIVDSEYEIVTGLKTGYTRAAGRCLLTTTENEQMRLVSAVFKSEGDQVYSDSRKLIDYVYSNFKTEPLISKGEVVGEKRIIFSKEKIMRMILKEDYKITLGKDEDLDGYRTSLEIYENLKLPLNQDTEVGKLNVYKSDELLESLNVYPNKDIESVFFKIIEYNKILLLIVGVIFIIVLTISKKNTRKRKKIRVKRINKTITKI